MKAAIIGCGRIGALFELEKLREKPCSHLGAYIANGIEVTAIADTDISRLQATQKIAKRLRQKTIPHGYENLGDMLRENGGLDIISICTPASRHFFNLMDILDSGKPPKAIFCEKPMALTSKECASMISRCKDAGTILAVNHTRRWNWDFWTLRSLLQGKAFGKPIHFLGVFSGDRLDVGIHMFDLANMLVPNLVGLELNGVGGNLSFFNVASSHLIFECDIFTDTGKIEVRDNGREFKVYKVGKSKHYDNYMELFPASDMPHTVNPPNPLVVAVENITDCIKARKVQPECTGEDGMKAVMLYEKVVKG